jgi:alpha-tubulin suppressor-like RCC1 family protein
MKPDQQGMTMQGFMKLRGSGPMKALAGMLAGCMLAVGCGPVAEGEEDARGRTAQAIRATSAVHLASGRHHQMMVRSDGTVWTVGRNTDGQLGTGQVITRSDGTKVVEPATSDVAVQVLGLPTDASVVSVAAGLYHSLVLLSDGRVYGWGRGTSGLLGSTAASIQITPVQVQFPANMSSSVVALSAGESYSLALLADGTVYAWGSAVDGALGNGTTSGVFSTPVKVQFPTTSPVVAIASGQNHNLAVLVDGTNHVVYAWGNNSSGKLGLDPLTTTRKSTPVLVGGISSAMDVAAGNSHSLALLSNGTVLSWGANSHGQLGDGQADQYGNPVIRQRITPGLVVNLAGVTRIGAGYTHSLAVDSTGTAWIWGDSDRGQGGTGMPCLSIDNYGVAKIFTPTRKGELAGPVTFVSGREDTSVVEIDDGTTRSFWGWGLNNYGQVGPMDPTLGHAHIPRQLL